MCYNKEGWKSLTQKEKILAEPLRQEVQDKAAQGAKMLTTFKSKLGGGRSKLQKSSPNLATHLGDLVGFLDFVPFLFVWIA